MDALAMATGANVRQVDSLDKSMGSSNLNKSIFITKLNVNNVHPTPTPKQEKRLHGDLN